MDGLDGVDIRFLHGDRDRGLPVLRGTVAVSRPRLVATVPGGRWRLAVLCVAMVLAEVVLGVGVAHAADPYQWRDKRNVNLVTGWKGSAGGVQWYTDTSGDTRYPFETPYRSLYRTTVDQEPADSDRVGQFTSAGNAPGAFVLTIPEAPSQPGTYSAVVSLLVRAVPTEDPALDWYAFRMHPYTGYEVNGVSTGASIGQDFRGVGYFGAIGAGAAPVYGGFGPSAVTQRLQLSEDGLTPPMRLDLSQYVNSEVVLAYTFRPRATADYWDVYWYASAFDSGWFAHESALGTGTLVVAGSRTATAPLTALNMSAYVSGSLAIAEWTDGSSAATEAVSAGTVDSVATVWLEAFDSHTSPASDEVMEAVRDSLEVSNAWVDTSEPTASVPPTASLPPTSSSPASSFPPTDASATAWYDYFLNVMNPLRDLLWPLDVFGRMGGE